MKILLVANYTPDAQQSMQRFAALLERGLSEAGHDVRLIRPSIRFGTIRGVPGKKWLGHADKFLLFPRALRRAAEWADIVHVCDHSNAYYLKFVKDRSHVITCHDLIAVRGANGDADYLTYGWSGRMLQGLVKTGLSQAQHIVCVSDATVKDLIEVLGIDTARISRIYNGLNYPYSPMAQAEADARIAKLSGIPVGPFILHVGGNQWYKNRLGVLRIFKALQTQAQAKDLRLVMVGKIWTEEMKAFARQNGLDETVIQLNNVPEEDLRALYSRAELLLFPSLQEGFGWPIAEAQACGCPVATSNRAPMTEVGGDAAIYFDPLDAESVTRAVLHALGNQAALKEKGLANAARFAERVMIEAYSNLYARLANQPNVG